MRCFSQTCNKDLLCIQNAGKIRLDPVCAAGHIRIRAETADLLSDAVDNQHVHRVALQPWDLLLGLAQ